MKRLMENTVLVGFVTAWRLATVPTRRSPPLENATTDGVVRPPSAFSITVGSPPSSTAMHELVVPRSIPIVFAMLLSTPLRLQNLSVRLADLQAQPSRGNHADGPLAGRDRRGQVVPHPNVNALGHIRFSAHAPHSGRRA